MKIFRAILILGESIDSDMFRYLGCNFITSWVNLTYF